MDQARIAGMATGFAWSIVVTLIVLIGGGVLLDANLGTTPWLTLAGVALGLVCAAYQLWELTRLGDKRKPSGPIGRRLEQRAMRRGNE
jgi:F0F1-type ATP synthase assembly protein I